MKEYKIRDNYIYIECLNDVELYQLLEHYLNEGYEISDSLYLSVELKKHNSFILLSYLTIENKDNDIKASINKLYSHYEIMTPNYNNTILNIIGSIRINYGYDFKHKSSLNVFNHKYDNMIIMILDGLGTNILKNNFDDDSFLKSIHIYNNHAIYPSTTAASTTSTKCGLSPIESGWTGWENYIKETNRNIVLFTGNNYHTDEPTGINGFQKMPYSPFFSDMDIKGYIIEPDFSKEKDLNELLDRSLKTLKKHKKSIQYVYYTEPDSLMHEYGSYSKPAKNECKYIDSKIKEYCDKLPENTLLIITADHGHTDVEPLRLSKCKVLLELLNRSPSNDARCITFSVKDGFKEKFELIFNSLFSFVYKLYKTEDAIKLGFFGLPDDIKHERIDDFLADYVAVAINKYYFEYKQGDSFVFKSHHAGITKDEMEVPILIYRK